VDDERQRLEAELDAAIQREAEVQHALRFSPSPRNPPPDDPRVAAARDVEAARLRCERSMSWTRAGRVGTSPYGVLGELTTALAIGH
jgi:hypothetical protein